MPEIYFSCVMDHLQISLLTLSEFNRISERIVPLKSLENHWFSDDFRRNRGLVIQLNLFNIRDEI